MVATALPLLSGTAVQAAVCTVHIGDLDFGNVDTIGNSAATTSSDVTIDCDGVAEGTSTITMCGNIGTGGGGAAGGVRQSTSAGSSLGFALYAAGNVPWGSSTASGLGDPYEIDVPVSGTSGSVNSHLYGAVLSGQKQAAVGDYSSDFSSADVDFKYAEGPLDCSSPTGADEASAPFSVRASVPANCLLQTADLDFGTTGLIGNNIDANTSVGVTCTPGTGYQISIDGGRSGDPDHRLMYSGANTVRYGLFRDAQRLSNWGTAADELLGNTGDGTQHHETVYGRIPPQAAAPGNYSDTVVVTITY